MRLMIAVLAAVVVLGGSAVAVASTTDNDEGRRQARAIALLAEMAKPDCDVGCTAGLRAQERIESGLADADAGAP
jgi:hypothetical protein